MNKSILYGSIVGFIAYIFMVIGILYFTFALGHADVGWIFQLLIGFILIVAYPFLEGRIRGKLHTNMYIYDVSFFIIAIVISLIFTFSIDAPFMSRMYDERILLSGLELIFPMISFYFITMVLLVVRIIQYIVLAIKKT